jgi:hypothetical protein
MRAAPLLLLFPLLLLLIACGGGAAADAPPKAATPSAPPSEEGTGDLGAAKASFVADCSKDEPGSEAYCGCAWDVARATYGDDAVRAKGTPSPDDLAKIHVKVGTTCGSLFPPEVIERAFMAGCTKKQPELSQYCACTWAELIKKMKPAELVSERAKSSERYRTAVQGSANACGRLRPSR